METSSLRKDIYERLQAADWGEIGKNLVAFAILFARTHYGWWDASSDQLPKGMKFDDIVQQVILKTIDGRRQWDPAKGPLEPWLKDQVKSELDALYKSAAHRRESHSVEVEEGNDGSETLNTRRGHQDARDAPGTPSAEEKAIEREEEEFAAKKVGAIFEQVAGQPDLEDILSAIMDGCEPKPQALADALGVPISEINNRLKRLRRRAIEVREELEHG